MTLLSLHHDVWCECLKFLSPPDMVVASTQICKSLSSTSSSSSSTNNKNSSSDRASWLALESAIQKAKRVMTTKTPPLSVAKNQEERKRRRQGEEHNEEEEILDENAGSTTCTSALTTNNATCFDNSRNDKKEQPRFRLDRYPGETWMGLYNLFWSLIGAASRRNNSWTGSDNALLRKNEYNDEHKANTVWIVTCWLLFGYPETIPPSCLILLNNGEANVSGKFLHSFLGNDLHQTIMSHQKPINVVFRTRILQAALRLSDAGDWEGASRLLGNVGDCDNIDRSESLERANGNDFVPREHDAEINICICTFLIDRLYCNTYVRANTNDTADLDRAVTCGRKAVSFCQTQYLQTQGSGGTSMDTMTSSHDIIDSNTANMQHQYRHNPPAPVSIYCSNSVRLAASCLALGKALALLAQHLGLRATYSHEIDVRPIDDRNRDGRSVDEKFFQEGEKILQDSIDRLEEEENQLLQQQNNGKRMSRDAVNDSKLSRKLLTILFEMRVATYAALGELYYCSASVASYSNEERCARQTEESIKYLQMSLRTAQQRIVENIKQQQEKRSLSSPQSIPIVTVESLCSTASRSLMLLQARTAKDLGKVFNFRREISTPVILNERMSNMLDFALAINLRLHFEGHPSVSNIRRLLSSRRHHHPSPLATTASVEDDVNEWIQQNPLFDIL